MANPNDHIIEEVFEALLPELGPQSPEFTFYNSMKLANVPIDNRMLANFMVQDFPWPIGVELRRLFSGDRKVRDKNRVEQILRVAERSAQFFCFCLLSQLWDEGKKAPLALSADFNAQITQFDRPSFGIYIGLIRAIDRLFEQHQIVPFLGYQQADFKFSDLMTILNDLVSKRNEDRHMQTEMDCEEAEQLLKQLLIKISFFARFKLVTIKEIRVWRPKLQNARFSHTIKMLNSQHEDFTAVEQAYDDFSDSHSVILIKSLEQPAESLNLSPLVVDTSAVLENQRVPGIKNGIYLYSLQKGDKYIYAHTSAPESVAFNTLPNFSDLEAQFKDLKKTLMPS